MNRYHKTIYFPKEHDIKLYQINDKLNWIKCYGKTTHSIDRLKERADFITALKFINNMTLRKTDIFEYYIENGNVEKVCYRISYNNYEDIIIVLSKKKAIITAWINNKNDSHKTLDKTLYEVK